MNQKNILLYQKKIGCSAEELTKIIEEIIKNSFSKNFYILTRVKNSETLIKKMNLKKVESVFEIEDVFGFRILVNNTDEIYEIFSLVSEAFDFYIDHDYIKNPKILPEQAHLESLRLLQIIAYKNKIPFEIQITTFKYNKINESLHRRYNIRKYG